MTEQEIERCLERFTMGKVTDVMNFDYAGTLAYLQRLKAENAALRERLGKSPDFEVYQDVFIIDYLDARGYSVIGGNPIIRSCFIRSIMQVGKNSFIYFVQPNDLPKELLDDSTLHDEYWDRSFYSKEIFVTREAAEVRLTESKGGSNDR